VPGQFSVCKQHIQKACRQKIKGGVQLFVVVPEHSGQFYHKTQDRQDETDKNQQDFYSNIKI
jgi:hypothetical protein